MTIKSQKKNFLKKINIFETLNLKKILLLVPFVFGFIQIYSLKYKDKSFYFLSENIFFKTKRLEETNSWNTFNFFKVKNIKTTNIRKYDVYKNSLFIQLKRNIFFQPIGTIKKKYLEVDENKFNSLYFLKIEEFILYAEHFYKKNLYINDTIPKKIDEATINKKFKKINNFFKKKKTIEFLDKKNLDEKIIFSKSLKNPKKRLIFSKLQTSQKKNKIYAIQQYSLSENNNFHSIVLNKKFFYNKSLKHFFYTYNLQYSNREYKDKYKKKIRRISKKLNRYSNITILKYVDNSFKLKNSLNNKIQCRLNSGYKYVDYNKKQVISFYNQNKNTNEQILRIILPSNIYSLTTNKDFILQNKYSFYYDQKNGFLGKAFFRKSKKFLIKRKNFFDIKMFPQKTKKYRKIEDFFKKSFFVSIDTTNFWKNRQPNLKENFALYYNQKNDFSIPFKSAKRKNFVTSVEKRDFLENTKKKSSVEHWEKLSISSWIYISKFLLFIYVLNLLKTIYQDYGKEMINYLIKYGKTTKVDFEAIKEQYLYEDPGYRIVTETKHKLKDIIGIDFILPVIGEIILSLKISKKLKKFQKNFPKGFLISGPPGTGKTFLVQGIAGECSVPVIIQSGSLLIDPNEKGQGFKKLKKIFRKANAIAPAIIFIDEIDSFGEKRNNILDYSISPNRLVEILYTYKKNQTDEIIPRPIVKKSRTIKSTEIDENELVALEELTKKQQEKLSIEKRKTKLNLLTQFLIEMDGLQTKKGFIVFGATNRLKILDPAFMRPGRFDKILTLDFPSKTKRIQILKFYAKQRKIEKNISWTYLSKKTKGFTASELAALMNESTIQSIINNTTNTLQTIEKGIDYITSYNLQKNRNIKELKQIAYYQAGKATSFKCLNLKNFDFLVSLSLWKRTKNTRHEKNYKNLFQQTKTRSELENLLIFYNFGKAAELMLFYGQKNLDTKKIYMSYFGNDDQKITQFIAFLMIDTWYFYSTQILINKNNQIENTFQNMEEISLSSSLNRKILRKFEMEDFSEIVNTGNPQEHKLPSNWQSKTSAKIARIDNALIDWYRIYIPDPEEKNTNIDWIPPDLFIQTNTNLKYLSNISLVQLNNLYKIERDSIFHSIILNSFDIAFSKIEKYRSIVDYFAFRLLSYGILREIEIKNL